MLFINKKTITSWLKKRRIVIKLLLLIKPNRDIYKYYSLEVNVSAKTWQRHDDIIRWSERCLRNQDRLEKKALYLDSTNPIVRQGYLLKEKVKNEYKGKYRESKIRILIHIPPVKLSPAGFSLFHNFLDSFNFLGIKADKIYWTDSYEDKIKSFKPNVFLSSDNAEYIKKVDWETLTNYKKKNKLKIGLTASLEEYGNSPLEERLEYAKGKGVSFYYSFRSPEYIAEREEYKLFIKEGFSIANIEFGVNPLIYYPVPNMGRDLNYVFLASSNPDKWNRYFQYLEKVFSKYDGFIDGPGWNRINNFRFNRNRDRYIYARSKVGINLSLSQQIQWPCELNERTYMLAACGVPQLIDNPKLLENRYGCDSFFVAQNPREYFDLYKYIINNQDKAIERALIAQKKTFEKHTTFHRIDSFLVELKRIIKG